MSDSSIRQAAFHCHLLTHVNLSGCLQVSYSHTCQKVSKMHHHTSLIGCLNLCSVQLFVGCMYNRVLRIYISTYMYIRMYVRMYVRMWYVAWVTSKEKQCTHLLCVLSSFDVALWIIGYFLFTRLLIIAHNIRTT